MRIVCLQEIGTYSNQLKLKMGYLMKEYSGMSQNMWLGKTAGLHKELIWQLDIWSWYYSVLLWTQGAFAPFSSFCSPPISASASTRQAMVSLSPVDITLQIKCSSTKTQLWYPYLKLFSEWYCLGMPYGLFSLVSQAFGVGEERVTWYRLGKIAFLRSSHLRRVRAQ